MPDYRFTVVIEQDEDEPGGRDLRKGGLSKISKDAKINVSKFEYLR